MPPAWFDFYVANNGTFHPSTPQWFRVWAVSYAQARAQQHPLPAPHPQWLQNWLATAGNNLPDPMVQAAPAAAPAVQPAPAAPAQPVAPAVAPVVQNQPAQQIMPNPTDRVWRRRTGIWSRVSPYQQVDFQAVDTGHAFWTQHPNNGGVAYVKDTAQSAHLVGVNQPVQNAPAQNQPPAAPAPAAPAPGGLNMGRAIVALAALGFAALLLFVAPFPQLFHYDTAFVNVDNGGTSANPPSGGTAIVTDVDGDGVTAPPDMCPADKGVLANNGCPAGDPRGGTTQQSPAPAAPSAPVTNGGNGANDTNGNTPQADCPTVVEASRLIAGNDTALVREGGRNPGEEACLFEFRKDLSIDPATGQPSNVVKCPDGWACELDTVGAHGHYYYGGNNSYNIDAGSFRLTNVYAAGDPIHTPCAALANSRDHLQFSGAPSSFQMLPGNFACEGEDAKDTSSKTGSSDNSGTKTGSGSGTKSSGNTGHVSKPSGGGAKPPAPAASNRCPGSASTVASRVGGKISRWHRISSTQWKYAKNSPPANLSAPWGKLDWWTGSSVAHTRSAKNVTEATWNCK